MAQHYQLSDTWDSMKDKGCTARCCFS